MLERFSEADARLVERPPEKVGDVPDDAPAGEDAP